MCKKFVILEALAKAVGIRGAPYFRNSGSLKMRKNGSAPSLTLIFFFRFIQNFVLIYKHINILLGKEFSNIGSEFSIMNIRQLRVI